MGSTTAAMPAQHEPIAVIGFDIKLPGEATSPEAFWKVMQEGRNLSTEVPADRANMDAFYHPNPDKVDTVS